MEKQQAEEFKWNHRELIGLRASDPLWSVVMIRVPGVSKALDAGMKSTTQQVKG